MKPKMKMARSAWRASMWCDRFWFGVSDVIWNWELKFKGIHAKRRR